jgi:nucleoside phosphorylase
VYRGQEVKFSVFEIKQPGQAWARYCDKDVDTSKTAVAQPASSENQPTECSSGSGGSIAVMDTQTQCKDIEETQGATALDLESAAVEVVSDANDVLMEPMKKVI